MNDTFSSLDLAAKVDRSKKFRVEIGKEEKKGSDGSEAGVGLFCGCRVTIEASIAAAGILNDANIEQTEKLNTLEIPI